jgi:hypothetical protein
MLTNLAEFNQIIIPSFEHFNNIIVFKNIKNVLVNNIKAITQSKSNSIRFPKFGYNFEYLLDVEMSINSIDPIVIVGNSDIQSIFFYDSSFEMGYKLKHIKTNLIESAVHQVLETPVFYFNFNIDVSSCDMITEDDLFLIRTLLLQKL